MERVLGIGGVFFRCDAPQDLARWCRDVLGIDLAPVAADQRPWMAEGGATVFAPFAADTTYFDMAKPFMINFRVRDLDAVIAQIEASGTPVERGETMSGIRRFARLADPEGTPIELWEPVSP